MKYLAQTGWVVFLLITSVIKTTFAQGSLPKAVFVIADGIPADVIERLRPPAFELISKKGGYTRAHVGGLKGGYSQTPTISAVGYNSLLTGTWVNKHNVWDNDIAAPNYHYSTIFTFFKKQYPAAKTAVFSTWLDNRTKLLGSDAKEAGHFMPDYYFDGMELDTVRYPHDKDSKYIHLIDEAVADTAASVIRSKAPDLSWIYLEYTDDMGHRYGDGPRMDEAVMLLDKQISRIWNAMEYRRKNFREDWVIFITTDHGRTAGDGKHHGGQSDRERTTWIVTNATGLNARFKSNPGIVDIMPTLARFLNVKIPREQLMEIDGIPLTGPVSATELSSSLAGDEIKIKWNPLDKKGQARVWMAVTNHFKKGGRDDYKMMGTVAVAAGEYNWKISDAGATFYKIVVEFPHHFLNSWIISP